MAKLFASETGKEVVEESFRIHGGYGYSKEYEIERLYRDAPLLLIGEGTSEIQRMVIGKKLPAAEQQDLGVSAADTKTLIAQAVNRLHDEALPAQPPAGDQAGAAHPRPRRPDLARRGLGPKVDRDPAADSRIDVSAARPRFNELAAEGSSRTGRAPTSAARSR